MLTTHDKAARTEFDMQRRTLLPLLLTLLSWPVSAIAQSGEKVLRIGLLAGFATAPEEDRQLTEGLREQSLVEGRNLVIERGFADGDFSKIPVISREMAAMRFDVVTVH